MNKKYTHVVTYIGHGKWQDAELKAWANKAINNTDIKDARAYTDDLTHDEFLASRPDFKFMMGYKHMTCMTVNNDGVEDVPVVPVVEPAAEVNIEPAAEVNIEPAVELDELKPTEESKPEPIAEIEAVVETVEEAAVEAAPAPPVEEPPVEEPPVEVKSVKGKSTTNKPTINI